ncbi:MAG: hypothetical protein ACMXYM_00065 [Candidatus Woesearchaeota archaeon]
MARARTALRSFQKGVRSEIDRLHHATEHFVRTATHHAKSKDHLEALEEHVLEIGRNIDELEEMLFNLHLK